MAEIIPFPELPRRRPVRGAHDTAELRRSIAELDRARARLDRHGANLAQQGAALAAVRRDLQGHVAHARELEVLADAIHDAAAAGDLAALGRLELHLRRLMARHPTLSTPRRPAVAE